MALGHVGQAHAAGVKILAGTDAGDTYVFPGFGIHDELVELVRAGLSPATALRAATLDAAVFAGMDNDFGSIAVGKAGDLILLDANPLDDVRHTQRIAGLFFNGEFFDRAALDNLLGFAEGHAGSVRSNLQLLRSRIHVRSIGSRRCATALYIISGGRRVGVRLIRQTSYPFFCGK